MPEDKSSSYAAEAAPKTAAPAADGGARPGVLTALMEREAAAAGINPRILHGIRRGESGHRADYDFKDDRAESSWGPLQLNRRGGLGAAFERDTGLDVRNPATIPAQVRWAARHIARRQAANPNYSPSREWFGYRGPSDADPSWGESGYRPGGGAATAVASSSGQHDPLGGIARRESSGYGMRTHPIHGDRRFHAGVDLAAPTGSAVYSMQAGRVTSVNRFGDVTIRHADGSSRSYRHIHSSVQVGQDVGGGQRIGAIRAHDLRATGPHLHVEATDAQGRRVNPSGDIASAKGAPQPGAEGEHRHATRGGRRFVAAGGGDGLPALLRRAAFDGSGITTARNAIARAMAYADRLIAELSSVGVPPLQSTSYADT